MCVAGIGEAHALVLGRDVAQIRGELGELGRRAQPPVHERPAPRLRFLSFLSPACTTRRMTSSPLPPSKAQGTPAASSFAATRDPGSISKSASTSASDSPVRDDVRPRPPPEDERERVDDHRLAGPGLAREDVEAGLQLERHPLEEDDVSGGELDEHGLQRLARLVRRGRTCA